MRKKREKEAEKQDKEKSTWKPQKKNIITKMSFGRKIQGARQKLQ